MFDSADIVFQSYAKTHRAEVTDIYNGYVVAGTAAFAQEPVPWDFFDFLMDMPAMYPVLVLLHLPSSRVAGFCFLSPHHPASTFRKTANIDYFISPAFTGKGLGTLCLQRLEEQAKKAGISHIVATVSSENWGSISFHKKHGFRQCGILERVGNKLGRDFGVVYMQKDISP